MENGNIKSLRFEEMDAVGQLMKDEMELFKDYFRKLKIFDDDPIESYCLDFVQEKISNKPLRAYFFTKMFAYLCHYKSVCDLLKKYDQQLFLVKLPFVFEIVICIQYLHNHILDEKYDSKATYHAKICQNLIASNIIREVLFTYLEKEIKPLCKRQEKYYGVYTAIRHLLILVDLGQRMDKSYTNYDHWKNGIPGISKASDVFDVAFYQAIAPIIEKIKADLPQKPAFIDAYFHRIYLTNVYLFRCMSDMIMGFAPTKRKIFADIKQFTIKYGFIIQIINDYSDFAYSPDGDLSTIAKKTTDIFSDLYNFNITLPLIYHLQEDSRRKILAYLESGNRKKKLLSQYPQQIMQEIVDSGGIRYCDKIARELSRFAKAHLDSENPNFPYFSNMCDIAYNNKFYRTLKKSKTTGS